MQGAFLCLAGDIRPKHTYGIKLLCGKSQQAINGGFLHYKWVSDSHLKNFTAILVHITVTAAITATGIHPFFVVKPRKADFISSMPCVSGKTLTIFCIAGGITSKGSVVPEKISIGKYKTQAITLALFEFFATPPTIIPILNVDTIVKSQLPKNAGSEPFILTFHISIAAGKRVIIDTIQYKT